MQARDCRCWVDVCAPAFKEPNVQTSVAAEVVLWPRPSLGDLLEMLTQRRRQLGRVFWGSLGGRAGSWCARTSCTCSSAPRWVLIVSAEQSKVTGEVGGEGQPASPPSLSRNLLLIRLIWSEAGGSVIVCTQCPGTAGLFKLQTRINPLLRCGGASRGNCCFVSRTPSPQAPQDLALLPPSPPTPAQTAPGRRGARESCTKGQGDPFQVPALTQGWAGGFPASRS